MKLPAFQEVLLATREFCPINSVYILCVVATADYITPGGSNIPGFVVDVNYMFYRRPVAIHGRNIDK
jgi:hypothetical protein